MKLLKMYIAKILIEQVEISYEGLITCQEKQELHERIAHNLKKKHCLKMYMAKDVVFFVTGESKMNHIL